MSKILTDKDAFGIKITEAKSPIPEGAIIAEDYHTHRNYIIQYSSGRIKIV